jgi:hypothetical protein
VLPHASRHQFGQFELTRMDAETRSAPLTSVTFMCTSLFCGGCKVSGSTDAVWTVTRNGVPGGGSTGTSNGDGRNQRTAGLLEAMLSRQKPSPFEFMNVACVHGGPSNWTSPSRGADAHGALSRIGRPGHTQAIESGGRGGGIRIGASAGRIHPGKSLTTASQTRSRVQRVFIGRPSQIPKYRSS